MVTWEESTRLGREAACQFIDDLRAGRIEPNELVNKAKEIGPLTGAQVGFFQQIAEALIEAQTSPAES